ncbi:Glycosyltransferase SypI [Vibrio cholerae]|uniref:glycosyltransferase family 4 protein n=1 Tax=Vibrio cholerae TaxID=666 RepID=UPI0011D7890F|nr:glycosyltransferase family 4 protein [Vibrio cholerae]TXZ05247.1 glycosyltransferase family 4 protein [Vibrio cholerae]BCN19750.1 N-acetyl-alpha-D-glucosaminyl L-malate synthase [Vibrio cholerae]BCN21265.1 N-acetyl-alpha-D-glucosaminyl L-malate synthase [Vibrio cholerae]GHX87160.1 Glycosyltransferase SypI [Vibrio cholerae]GHY20144.1 Glycosyltransferase SypI [Vibrio cholerae]
MNIAYVLPSLVKQAPIMVATSLANNLVKKGHNITVFYFSGNIEVELNPGIVVKKISFFKVLKLSDFDIVHSHLFRPDFFLFIQSFFNNDNVKLVSTLHNYVYPELRNYYNKLVSLIFGNLWNLSWTKFDRLIVLTNDAMSYYKKYSLNKRVSRVYNGHDVKFHSLCDCDSFALRDSLKEQGLVIIGTYCNLIKRKNISFLIDFIASYNDFALIVYGDGPELENLNNKIKYHQIEDRVFLMGYKENAYVYNEIFDIYAMPSVDEGFGLALIEAALYKKKIVCSDIPVFKEIFDEKSVSFFSPSDLHSLYLAIQSILVKTFSSDLAYDNALTKFSVETMSNNYLTIYKEICENNYG